MHRRTFISVTGAAACGAALNSSAAATPGRPNILIITTDQQFAEAVSYRIGTKYIHTPNMESDASLWSIWTRTRVR